MSLKIRNVGENDLDAILAINNATSPGILPLDGKKLRWFFDQAVYFRVAEVDGIVGGFIIGFRETADHDSSNFLWFRDHYPAFVYIDRVVIAPSLRGRGLGRVFYADVQSYAELRVPMVACEVFLEPRNDAVVLFHGTFGFHEVAQQRMAGNNRRVSLLAKELCSFQFVRDTYLEHGGLPRLAWLENAERARLQDHPVPAPQAAGHA